MATQRFISTSFWDDRWIRSLDPSERYLYLYLITNPLTNIAGVYQITIDRIAFDTGYDERTLRPMLQRFTNAGKAIYHHDEWVILPRWPKHQRWEKSKQIAEGIERVLRELPPDVRETLVEYGYTYPMDRVSIPHRYPRRYLDTDTDTDTDTDSDNAPTDSEPEKQNPETIQIADMVRIPASRLERLNAEHGADVVRYYAEKVADYCASHGKRYKDYARTIGAFIRGDKERGTFERIVSRIRSESARREAPKCPDCGRLMPIDGSPCDCKIEREDYEIGDIHELARSLRQAKAAGDA